MSFQSPVQIPAPVQVGCEGPIRSHEDYREAAESARQNPSEFWLRETLSSIAWRKAPTRGLEGSFHSIGDTPLRWFSDGTLNVTESCVDRHARSTPNRTAFIWESDDPGDCQSWTYSELYKEVCK